MMGYIGLKLWKKSRLFFLERQNMKEIEILESKTHEKGSYCANAINYQFGRVLKRQPIKEGPSCNNQEL